VTMDEGEGIKLIDIGANLTDPMFSGCYYDKQVHEPDLQLVLERARQNSVHKIIITAGRLEEVTTGLELSKTDSMLYTTVGVHPTRCSEFDQNTLGLSPDEYMSKLISIATSEPAKNKIIAVGEFGLDYDRTQYCPKEVQKKYFIKQFELVKAVNLPLFLHMRSACADFVEIIKEYRDSFTFGIVHSFDGSAQDLELLLELDLYIGINGCSLKTEENLEVVKLIPVNRLLIETDAPWCGIRNTHAGNKLGFLKSKWPEKDKKKWEAGKRVKGRNEPGNLIQVLEVIAGVKEMDINSLAEEIYKNTILVFFSK